MYFHFESGGDCRSIGTLLIRLNTGQCVLVHLNYLTECVDYCSLLNYVSMEHINVQRSRRWLILTGECNALASDSLAYKAQYDGTIALF